LTGRERCLHRRQRCRTTPAN